MEKSEIFTQELKDAAKKLSLPLTEEQISLFGGFYALLIAANRRVNLTAITEPKEAAIKHIIDSLLPCDEEFFPRGARVIDIGTGAGFPGLPLKIYRPDLKITLLDSLNKRVNFLKDTVKSLNLENTACVKGRAEDMAQVTDYREKYGVAVSRAVAPLNVLLEYALPFVATGGVFLALKGKSVDDEIAASDKALKILGGEIFATRRFSLPEESGERSVVIVKKTALTPEKYPRRAGTPTANPL